MTTLAAGSSVRAFLRATAFLALLVSLAAFAGQVCYLDPPRAPGAVGTGFYVSGGKLYDPTGTEFRIRGVNRTHWDSYGSNTGIPTSGANAVRMAISFNRTAAANLADLQAMLDAGVTPIVGTWTTTCSANPAYLSAAVDSWVAQASTWTTLNATGLVNIANEWGPSTSPIWRDNYITAIARMRAAGYTGTLVVDAGGCGQSPGDILTYGAAVLASDPEKNILFDVHVYGNFYYPATSSWQMDFATVMASLKATGLPILLGEFGPGKNIGPSPTLIPPEQVIATAEANGWGWMPWAWDDNNLTACASNDSGFSMTTKCGGYTGLDSELTAFGKVVVPLFKQYGAKRASLK